MQLEKGQTPTKLLRHKRISFWTIAKSAFNHPSKKFKKAPLNPVEMDVLANIWGNVRFVKKCIYGKPVGCSSFNANYFDVNIVSVRHTVGLNSAEPCLVEICISNFRWLYIIKINRFTSVLQTNPKVA